MTRYIRFLDEIGAQDLPLVGGKGANLGEMARAGLPAAPGFCLTADAYRDFIAAAGLDAPIEALLAGLDAGDADETARRSAAIRQLITSQPVPPAIAGQTLAAYGQLAEALGGIADGWQPVAVRSSATAEDLPTASFAGQQDTYLHVRGDEALLERVRACWASLWTARAIAYRARQGFDHKEVALSVVVQAMVDAEIAGVLFTANPVNGCREEMVLNASWGLGEAIVSGLVTPDTITVRKADGKVLGRQIAAKERMVVTCPAGGVEIVDVPAARREAEALSARQIAGLVALGRQVERHYQAPQDIEWACAGGRFYLLQARPITTLGAAGQATGEFSRTMLVEVFPHALSPSFASVVEPIFIKMLDFSFETLGFTPPEDKNAIEIFYGQPYISLDYISAALQPLSPPVRERLASQIISPFGRHEHEMRGELSWPYVRMVLRMIRFLQRLPRELQSVLERYRAAIDDARRLPLSSLSDEQIAAHIRRLALEDASEILDYDFLMIALIGITYQVLGSLLKPHYGQDVEELRARLISGVTGNVTMETNKRLWELAQVAKASPAVCLALRTHDWSRCGSLLGQQPADVLAALDQEPDAQDFLAALHAFLDRYGHRDIRLDTLYPTWGEDPTPVLGFVRSYLDVDDAHSPHRQQKRLVQEREALTEEVRAKMRRSPKGRLLLPLFDHVLSQTQAHTRERDTVHFELTRLFPPMRAMLHELGSRWTQAGLIEQADDIYYLTLDQVTALASQPQPMHQVVQTSRAAFVADQTRAWPEIIRNGEEVWLDQSPAGAAEAGVEGQWRGVAGSPHVATGAARIIRGPEDFHRLGKGEILVAPATDPAWTPLFALASAVVTEVGGILSHGAIVAREYGIPAVMGVRGITATLSTGQLVRVDGNRGQVQVVT
jgi:rifampicin phosphotransferase